MDFGLCLALLQFVLCLGPCLGQELLSSTVGHVMAPQSHDICMHYQCYNSCILVRTVTNFCGTTVNESRVAKNLGVTIDKHLNYQSHVDELIHDHKCSGASR